MVIRSRRSTLLIVLLAPFVVLAYFAERTLSVERAASHAQQLALLEERLDTTAKLALARLDLLGADQLAKAYEIASSGSNDALRDFVLAGNVAFALVFNTGHRIFPPPDSDFLLVQKLQSGLWTFHDPGRRLTDQLAGARGASVASLVETGPGAYALIRCSRGAGALDVCIAEDADVVERVVRAALTVAVHDEGGDRVWLVSPEGRRLGGPAAAVAPTISRALEGILAGWRIEALEAPNAQLNHAQTMAAFVLGGVLIAGWGALAWSLHRAFVMQTEAAARRTRLIAQLSHELRTPLANLRLYADLLPRKAADGDAIAHYAAVIGSEIARLEQIAENAIDIGRRAFGPPRLETGQPDAQLRSIVERFEPVLAAAGCRIEMNLKAAGECLYDRAAYERIVVNLLDNARKYAPGSPVVLSSSLDRDMLGLAVRDHGPGIPAEERAQVFEPLFRGAQAGSGGFGLGLSAVRSLAREHGGDAWAEDAAIGASIRMVMRVRVIAPCGESDDADPDRRG
jgi:signal transduction histidine kinase